MYANHYVSNAINIIFWVQDNLSLHVIVLLVNKNIFANNTYPVLCFV